MTNIFDAFTKVGFKTSESPPPKKSFQPPKNQHFGPKIKNSSATTPYNFVSLPEKILLAPFGLKNFHEYIMEHGKLSGEIILDIESLTPIFFGGNFKDNAVTFSPLGTPIIPGSSLRGMFKNIFKIVTCGAFRGRTTSQKKGEDFNDEHIYFRCLMTSRNSPAWMTDLHELYTNRMIRYERVKGKKFRLVKNARPGFLIRMTDNRFFIAPSRVVDNKDDRILIREYEKIFNEIIAERNSSCVKWNESPDEAQIDKPAEERRKNVAYIITGSQRRNRLYDKESYEQLSDEEKKKAGKQFIRFIKIDYVDWAREHWIALPDDVRTSYEHDRNRRGVNLFKDKGFLNRAELEQLTREKLPDVKSLIPCHYLEEDGQITAFGHGQCFRIPYQKRIGDAVPEALKSEEAVDFADALFGKGKFWASRVYFEDAMPKTFETLMKSTAHPLMQPNPTSYQLYLTQDDKNGNLKHWDSDAYIRGYKLYWHRCEADWHANESELKFDDGKPTEKRLTKEITPLDKESKFIAKIRFQNLSAVELGAFMMIFDLNGAKNPAYKIGQGKPFGFGSVQISAKLFLEDETAYTQFFDTNGWKNPYREENPSAYMDLFKKYLQDCGMLETWRKVMVELKEMLDWSQTNTPYWNEKIKSMSGNVSERENLDRRFKERAPLPTIFEVVKK